MTKQHILVKFQINLLALSYVSLFSPNIQGYFPEKMDQKAETVFLWWIFVTGYVWKKNFFYTISFLFRITWMAQKKIIDTFWVKKKFSFWKKKFFHNSFLNTVIDPEKKYWKFFFEKKHLVFFSVCQKITKLFFHQIFFQ